MLKAANGLARALKAEGVPFVTVFPSCRLNNALGEEGLRLIMMRDERYAIGVADAYARVSNGKRFGVSTVQGGVNACGVQFASAPLAQAFEDSSPVLCLTDAVPIADADNSHYNIDRVFSQFTKWTTAVHDAGRVPAAMARAVTNMRMGRPGPVLLQIAGNLGEYDDNAHPYEPVQICKSQADPTAVRSAVKALLAAKRPLIYAGEGVFYADACEELKQFAELAQAPVLTTLKGKSAFPENHPLSVGVRGEPAEHFLATCDLLFAVGSSISPHRFSHAIPDAKDKTIVQCTVDTKDINKSYRVNYPLVGDAKLVLGQINAELGAQTGGGLKPNRELLDEIVAAKRALWEKYQPALTADETPINPYRVYYDLMNTIDRQKSLVTGDSGSTRDQLSTMYEALVPHGFKGWGNVSTLGFSMAVAMGAKLAYPERTCVGVTGDAGVAYMLGNLEALVRYEVGVTIIHINNSCFAGFGPGFWGPGIFPYTSDLTPCNLTNLARTADAIGLHAERVESPKEIIPALRRAFDANASNQPAYLEMICSQYPVWGTWVGMKGRLG